MKTCHAISRGDRTKELEGESKEVSNGSDLNGQEERDIKLYWPYSWVKVKACDNLLNGTRHGKEGSL